MTSRLRVSIDTSSVMGQFLGRHEVHRPGPAYDLYLSVHVVGGLFFGAYKSGDPRRGCAHIEDLLTFVPFSPQRLERLVSTAV